MSFPEPPVIVFASVEPRIETGVVVPLASTLTKRVTTGVPATCWLALARFTFAATSRYSVEPPVPPLIDVSEPW